MRKLIDFKDKADQIQDYANKNTNGNYTKAVLELIDKALKLNEVKHERD